MPTRATRLADPTKILTRRELAAVLADLRPKAPRSKNTRLNLVVFRLATCCGLRASEIAQLQLRDVHVELPRPHLKIRASAAKGGKPRSVPLWWDAGTLEDLAAWRADRAASGANDESPFVCSLQPAREHLTFFGTRCESGFALRARCLVRNGSSRSRFTMAGIRLSAMLSPVVGH